MLAHGLTTRSGIEVEIEVLTTVATRHEYGGECDFSSVRTQHLLYYPDRTGIQPRSLVGVVLVVLCKQQQRQQRSP